LMRVAAKALMRWAAPTSERVRTLILRNAVASGSSALKRYETMHARRTEPDHVGSPDAKELWRSHAYAHDGNGPKIADTKGLLITTAVDCLSVVDDTTTVHHMRFAGLIHAY